MDWSLSYGGGTSGRPFGDSGRSKRRRDRRCARPPVVLPDYDVAARRKYPDGSALKLSIPPLLRSFIVLALDEEAEGREPRAADIDVALVHAGTLAEPPQRAVVRVCDSH